MAYNVLIVDDSRTARMFISKAIEVSGLSVGKVMQAQNGKEGLEMLQKEWVDIVFADINMPEMTGVEMVQKMCEDGLMKTVPVVIVSTERSATRIAELKAAGVREYLNKPCTPENIKKVVDEVLGKQER